MIEQLISELEAMLGEIEASGIEVHIDISRLREIILSIKNGSGYATMSELQAEIGKVRTEIAAVRAEVSKVDKNLHTEIAAVRVEVSKVDKNLHKEIAAVRTEVEGVRTKVEGVRTEVEGVRTEIQRALREQTVRIITIVSVMLGIVVAAISIAATVISLLG